MAWWPCRRGRRHVEVYGETTPCQQLYKVLKEENKLEMFVNFMENHKDLLTLEINRKTKLLDKYCIQV